MRDDDEIMLLTAKGQSVRCPVKDIRETNRGAKGVKLLTLADGDKLLSVAKVVETAEENGADPGDAETAPESDGAADSDSPPPTDNATSNEN